jgi:hypothetical protein
MKINPHPIVGNWYQHLDKGPLFMVVALDEQEGLIELQHFDADIEEVDMVTWFSMELERAEAPEDWTGPMDNIERDDLGYNQRATSGSAWRKPLQDTPGVGSEGWENAESDDDDIESFEAQPPEEV